LRVLNTDLASVTVEIFDIERVGGGGGRGPRFFVFFVSQRSSHFAMPRHAALVRALRSMRGEPSRLRLRWTLFWMMLTSHERCPSS
jgi:hypothetical protein